MINFARTDGVSAIEGADALIADCGPLSGVYGFPRNPPVGPLKFAVWLNGATLVLTGIDETGALVGGVAVDGEAGGVGP